VSVQCNHCNYHETKDWSKITDIEFGEEGGGVLLYEEEV